MKPTDGLALPQEIVRQSTRESRIEVVDSWADFQALSVEWNDLADRCGGEIFSRHEFMANWLAHFAADRFHVLTLWDAYGRLTAVLPLVRSRTTIYGVPVRQLHSASNSHSGRFDLLADDAPAAADAIVEHLAARRDWDAVVLSEISGASAALALQDRARAARWLTGRWRAPESPSLALPPTWDELEQTLSGDFRRELRRRRRRLMELGRVTTCRSGDDLRALGEGMALEARGWKGRSGTAMIQQSCTRDFYTNLATRMAGQGALSIWTLRVDDRLVAFQYGIEDQGTYYLLKPAYDEAFSRFSPGQLLMESVLEDAIERGLDRFDFLGDSARWKAAWRPVGQPRRWLYLFRSAPIPWVAHGLKFRVAPAVRRQLVRS